MKAIQKAAKEQAAAEAKAVKDAEKQARAAQKQAEKDAAVQAKAAEKAQKEAEKAAALEAKKTQQMPEQNGIRRPKPEGLCGQAWTVFDNLSTDGPVSIKVALETTTPMGLKEGNVKAEYARWRKFNGVTGRVVDPRVAEEKAAADAAKELEKQRKAEEKAAKAAAEAEAKAQAKAAAEAAAAQTPQ